MPHRLTIALLLLTACIAGAADAQIAPPLPSAFNASQWANNGILVAIGGVILWIGKHAVGFLQEGWALVKEQRKALLALMTDTIPGIIRRLDAHESEMKKIGVAQEDLRDSGKRRDVQYDAIRETLHKSANAQNENVLRHDRQQIQLEQVEAKLEQVADYLRVPKTPPLGLDLGLPERSDPLDMRRRQVTPDTHRYEPSAPTALTKPGKR